VTGVIWYRVIHGAAWRCAFLFGAAPHCPPSWCGGRCDAAAYTVTSLPSPVRASALAVLRSGAHLLLADADNSTLVVASLAEGGRLFFAALEMRRV
jgi:hypothetical protein